MGLRKILGINWDIDKDLFEFDFDEIAQLAKDLKFTKKKLLKINATLFDPLRTYFSNNTTRKTFV